MAEWPLSAYIARVYGARAVAREIGERREEKVEKTARDVNWVRFAFFGVVVMMVVGQIGFVSLKWGVVMMVVVQIGFVSHFCRVEIGFVSHFLVVGWASGWQIGFVSRI